MLCHLRNGATSKMGKRRNTKIDRRLVNFLQCHIFIILTESCYQFCVVDYKALEIIFALNFKLQPLTALFQNRQVAQSLRKIQGRKKVRKKQQRNISMAHITVLRVLN